MEFGPIWRALLHNKTSYLLIVLQIAVTMAIMVNAIGIIQERSILMTRPSGVDEDNLFYLNSTGFEPDTDYKVLVDADLEAIRSFPGVRNAVSTNTVPLQGGGWSQGLQAEPGEEIDKTGVALYFMDEQGIDTFGVNLIAGRNFTPTEVSWYDPTSERRWPNQIIISKAMAEEFFPDISPEETVGKIIFIENDMPLTVIGVLERLQAPWKSWSGVERSMFVPQRRNARFARYVIRTEPGYRDEVIPQIEKMLAESNKGRIIRHTKSMDEVRARSYLQESAMIKLLIFIVSLLTAITSLGIVGLASFSVARRTKQIGTRRALGATRLGIQRYFMLENFLISSVGVIGGAMLAVGLNIWMVQTFELAPIAWYLVPAAMLSLWIIGQLAVYGPARRASMVSPAVATRAM